MRFRALLLLGSALLLVGAMEPIPQPKPLDPVESAKQGRALADQIISIQPLESITNMGVLKIRDPDGNRRELRLSFHTRVGETNWVSAYGVQVGPKEHVTLRVSHRGGQADYLITTDTGSNSRTRSYQGNETMIPFANSDFWVGDLGLEFYRWPEQRLIKKELRRSRLCRVLESINPKPTPGSYLRVVSWIDNETDGIVHAEAYDLRNKLLKEFDPDEFVKVQGQLQLESMEISNRQTGSRTRIEFNLGKK
jgi:hypothetical protein